MQNIFTKKKKTNKNMLPSLTHFFTERYWPVHLPHTGSSHSEVCLKKQVLPKSTWVLPSFKIAERFQENFGSQTLFQKILYAEQSQIYNPVEYPRWSCFAKIVNGWKPLTIFAKMFHLSVRPCSNCAAAADL